MKAIKFKPRNYMKVLKFIKEHPKQWNQRDARGPCGCFLYHVNKVGKLGLKHWWLEYPPAMVEFLGIPKRKLDWFFDPRRTIRDFENFYREKMK